MTGMKILHEKGFVAAEVCARLVEAWHQNRALAGRERGATAPFDGRVIHVGELFARDRGLGAELVTLAGRMAAAVAEGYGRAWGSLYPDDVQIVRWGEGHVMHPHADREHADQPAGAAHGTPWREFAGLVYLSDPASYEGGQVYFPELGVELAPGLGDFVAFGGGRDYLHGVKKITRGERFTCACWFTSDASHKHWLLR
jgi:predicted 2-oxoglutarate/Fe(II)-dependent dioxygenase YbiX